MPAEAIKVAVRVRPYNDREKELKSTLCVSMSGESTIVTNEGQAPKTFTFDFSYWSHDQSQSFATQTTVMEEVGVGILNNALNGFHGCLFAYGQTGAGKSYSVMGSQSDPGIIPLAVDEIFRQKGIAEAPGGDGEVRVWISFMEIYNENIHDLLHAGSDHPDLKVMDHPQLGIYIPGLTESACPKSDDVQKLMDYGMKRRVTAATNMNPTSSRSHAVFTIKVQKLFGDPPDPSKKDERKAWTAKINLVDLAGSERSSKTGAEGATLKEGCAINQSLSALGMVIKDLSEIHSKPKGKDAKGGPTKEAVPFRSSKLTFILKDSLSGNSKTVMMAAISPASDNSEETISTLRFASSVKKIKTVSKQNIDAKDEVINNLQAEIKKLKGSLGKKAPGALESASDVQDEIAHREKVLEDMSKGYEVHLAEAEHLQAEREDALKDQGLSSSEIDEMFGIEKDTPYLLNMSSDPMLSGCLMYFLKAGVSTIGAVDENTIVVKGLGIPEHLCQIENIDHRNLTIMVSPTADPANGFGPKGKVRVNGAVIQDQEQAQKLKHFDKLMFGRAYAMRVVIPLEQNLLGQGVDGAEDPTLQANLHEHDLMKMLIPEDSDAWGELQLYLDDLWQRLGEDRGRELFAWLSEASHLTDEANDITQEMRPKDRMKFEVELVWDIHREAADIIVIRVMQFPPDGTDASVLCYWTLAKFKERLEMMRDCFDIFHKRGSWDASGDVLEDPWLEPSFAELCLRLHNHTETELRKQEEKGAILAAATVGSSISAPAGGARSASPKAKAKGVAPKQLDAGAFSGGARSATSLPTRAGGRTIAKRAPRAAEDAAVAYSAPPPDESLAEALYSQPPPAPVCIPTTPQKEVTREIAAQQFEEAPSQPALQPPTRATGVYDDTLIAVLRDQLKEKDDKEVMYKQRLAKLQQRLDEFERTHGSLMSLAAENSMAHVQPATAVYTAPPRTISQPPSFQNTARMQPQYYVEGVQIPAPTSVRRIQSGVSTRSTSPMQLGRVSYPSPLDGLSQIAASGQVLSQQYVMQRGQQQVSSQFIPNAPLSNTVGWNGMQS